MRDTNTDIFTNGFIKGIASQCRVGKGVAMAMRQQTGYKWEWVPTPTPEDASTIHYTVISVPVKVGTEWGRLIIR